MRILVIIPARCGSKGIKEKNIVDVCGKPLISYSIEQAIKLKREGMVEEVIVSTDCQKISEISQYYGAKVPFLRPKEISRDDSKSIDFIIHALEYYNERSVVFNAVLLLQPTSPTRDFNVLKESINIFNRGCNDSLISVYKEEYVNQYVMYKLDNINLVPLNKFHNKGIRRQEHESIYVRNGSIYITRSEYLINNRAIISDTPLMVEMKKIDSVNIDNDDDLELVRRLICK